MKLITILILLLMVGCSTAPATQSGQEYLLDADYLMNEITVTHKIAIPGTNQYCEVDNDNNKIISCDPIQVYSETEE